MSGSLTRPDWAVAIKALNRRLDILERRLTPSVPASFSELVFSYAGPLVSDTESPPKALIVPATAGLLVVAFKPGSAGSTDTILELKRSGVVMATITVPASAEDHSERIGVTFTSGQRISLRVDTAGTGAADMTATARFT